MNIYEELGLQRIINASGKMTKLGVSTFSDKVGESAVSAGQSFVLIKDLYKKAGEIISSYTGAEASCVTNSASAAIAMSIAGLITKGSSKLIREMPDSVGLANEVLIAKGHVIDYGAPIDTMIRLGGGKVVEVGYSNLCTVEDFNDSINSNTVAIFYVKSHHTVQKGMPDLSDLIKLAHQYSLPVVVDAAAEEDLKKYVAMGVDLTIYSGSKAIQATTSGFVTGNSKLVDYVQMQTDGIGRAMKIGKENIMGLLTALEEYTDKDLDKEKTLNHKKVDLLVLKLNEIDGLNCKKVKDLVREIYRAEVQILDSRKNVKEVVNLLNKNNPSIHVREHRINEGYISLDTRALSFDDIEEIILRFKDIMEVD